MKIKEFLRNPNNIWWIFGILFVIAVALFIFSYVWMEEKSGQKTREILGFIGGLASIVGILIAVLQNIQTKRELDVVKAVAKATEKTTSETKASIKKILDLDEISKFCEKTKLIQELIEEKEFKVAVYISKELQEKIIEINGRSYSDNSQAFSSLPDHIMSLGKNIGYMKKEIREQSEGIKVGKIIKDFDKLHNTMVEIKTSLTKI